MNELAQKVRIHVLDMVNYPQSSHIGSSYSIVEILVTLYSNILKINPKDLFQLIYSCTKNPKLNFAIDAYSKSPISK
jgi:hypothetical protein